MKEYILDLATLPDDISFNDLCAYLENNTDNEPGINFYEKIRQWIALKQN